MLLKLYSLYTTGDFRKSRKPFFGILDPINVTFDNKMNNDWGDGTDVSAKKVNTNGRYGTIFKF